MLRYGPNTLRAPAIDYQHAASQSGTTLGHFRARGPGLLIYLPDPSKPTQTLRATWEQSVELGREQGQPVLLMEGRPIFGMVETGAMTADRIKLYLRELQGDAASDGVSLPTSESSDAKDKLRLVPDRLVANGDVQVKTAQLSCRTEELLTTFNLQPTQAATVEPGSAATSSVPNPLTAGPQRDASRQPFELDALQMRLEVNMRGKAILPSSAVCEGNVVLREVALPNSTEQPLEIRGGQLTIDQLESGTAHIVLAGAGPGDKRGSKMAQLVGRGTTVLTEVVELDQRGNRLWSNGPGKATLILTRGMSGRTSDYPVPVDVSWQGGLQFDGQNVLIQKNVVVAGADDTLRCEELSAKLNAPIQLGQRVRQGAVDVAEIECRGRVSIDHRSRDEIGLTSHERIQLERLTINQQTGAVSGDGPGIIRSTRFGAGLEALTDPHAGGSPQAVPATHPTSGSKLHFLKIDFQRKLVGDIYVRNLSFDGRVRTVYGPVDAWEQELDGSRPEALPPDSVVLLCDTLSLNEDPLLARTAANAQEAQTRPLGPVQVIAQGNVHIDGSSESQGTFGALADRATYEQSKDVFLLEGASRTPAQLWLRRNAGVEVTPITAGRIRYDRSTGLPKVERLQPLEITPGNLEKADLPHSAPR
jgi:hypothetical protein